jgi:hypothetical protein
MVTIRREQMQALGEYMRGSFVEKMLRYLAGAFPAKYAAIGDAGAKRLINRGIEDGKKWGIDRERDVQRLVDLMAEFGGKFDEAAAGATGALEDKELSGQAKIGLLEFVLLGRVKDNDQE